MQDVHITGIQLFAGKQELISSGTLVLTYGTHYGLIGRNGVGKSTLLRAIGAKRATLWRVRESSPLATNRGNRLR